MSLILDNSDQNNQGRFEIQNSTTAAGTLVYAVLAPESANNQSATTTIGQTFTEPLEFNTGVFVEEISGTCTLTGVLNGYEE